MPDASAPRLEPWSAGDLPLLEQLLGDPAMMAHLGGPESHDQLVARQARYERLIDSKTDRMFKIIDRPSGQAVGSVDYWERSWRGHLVYETGWSVLPAFQGRSLASRATALAIAQLRATRRHRYLHAFPAVDNPPSNAICRKLGFTLLGACEFEYPAGRYMKCNDWRFDLAGSNEDSART
jgi:RimJ/RimL family protein N-acetyltransferase